MPKKRANTDVIKTVRSKSYPITKEGVIYKLKKDIRAAISKGDRPLQLHLQKEICFERSKIIRDIINNGANETLQLSDDSVFPSTQVTHGMSADGVFNLKQYKRDIIYGLNVPFHQASTDLTKTIGDIMGYLQQCALGCKTYILPQSMLSDTVLKTKVNAQNKVISQNMWLLQALFHKVFGTTPLNFVDTTVGTQLLFKSKDKVMTLSKDFTNVVLNSQLHDVENVYSGKFEIQFYSTLDVSINTQNEEHVFLTTPSLKTLNDSMARLGTHIIVFRVVNGVTFQRSEFKVIPKTPKQFSLQQILELAPLSPIAHEVVTQYSGTHKPQSINKLYIADKSAICKTNICRVITENECAHLLVSELQKKLVFDTNKIKADEVSSNITNWKQAWSNSNILFEFFSNIGYVFASLSIKTESDIPDTISILLKYNSLFVDMEQQFKDRSIKQYVCKYQPIKDVGDGMIQNKERWFISRYSDAVHDLEIRSLRDKSNANCYFGSFPKSIYVSQYHDPALDDRPDMRGYLGVGGDKEYDPKAKLLPVREDDVNPYAVVETGPKKTKKKTKPNNKPIGLYDLHQLPDEEISDDESVDSDGSVDNKPVQNTLSRNKKNIKVGGNHAINKDVPCMMYNTPYAYQNHRKFDVVQDGLQTGDDHNAWVCFCKFANMKRLQAQSLVSDHMVSLGKPSFLAVRGYIYYTNYEEEGKFRAYLHRYKQAQRVWEETWDEYLDDLEQEYNRLYKLTDTTFADSCQFRDARQYYSPYLFWYRDFTSTILNGISIENLQVIEQSNRFVAREAVACAMIKQKFNIGNNNAQLIRLCNGIINSIIFANPYISYALFSHILNLFHKHLSTNMKLINDQPAMNVFLDTIFPTIDDSFANDLDTIPVLPEYHHYIAFHNNYFVPKRWVISGRLIKYNIDKMIYPNDEKANEIGDRSIPIRHEEDQQLTYMTPSFVASDAMAEDDRQHWASLRPQPVNPNTPYPYKEPKTYDSDGSDYGDSFTTGILPTALVTGKINLPAHPGVKFNQVKSFIVNVETFLDEYRQDQPYTVYVWAYGNLFADRVLYTHVNGFNARKQPMGSIELPYTTHGPDFDEIIDAEQLYMMSMTNTSGWATDVGYAKTLFNIRNKGMPWNESQWTQFGANVSIAVMVWKCLCKITLTQLTEVDTPTFKKVLEFACKYYNNEDHQNQTQWHVHMFLDDFRRYVCPDEDSIQNGYYFISKLTISPTAALAAKLGSISLQISTFYRIFTESDTWFSNKNHIVAYPHEIQKIKRAVRRCPYLINLISSVLMDTIVKYATHVDVQYGIFSKFMSYYCNNYIKCMVLMPSKHKTESNVSVVMQTLQAELAMECTKKITHEDGLQTTQSLNAAFEAQLQHMVTMHWMQYYIEETQFEDGSVPHVANSKFIKDMHKKKSKD